MLRIALTATVAILLGAGPALAQQSGPIRLAPLPPAEPRSEPEPAADTGEDAAPSNVTIRDLDAVDQDAVGMLGDGDGGLGQDMWSGTARVDALRLVRNLPNSYASQAARALSRRLLLTVATPPAGRDEAANLLAARVGKLVEIGAPDDALSLVSSVSSRTVPPHLAAPVVRAHFLKGDTARGCDAVNQYTGGYAESFWQQALIICQIADGKGAEAALGLDLMREEGGAVGAVFQDVAHTAAVGVEVTPEQLAQPGSPDLLMYTLLRIAKAKLPGWLLDSKDPALVRAMLASGDIDADDRLTVTHRALRAGLIGGRESAAVYRSLDVADDELAAALLDPESVVPERLPAYLYLTAQRQTLPNARAEALWEAWTLSEAAEVDDIVMVTTAPLLESVPVTTDFGWLATVAARSALLAGEDELALAWFELVVRQARQVADTARAATLMWPEMRVIGRVMPDGEAADPSTPEPIEASSAAPETPPPVETALTRALAEAPRLPVAPRAPVPWSARRLERWIDLAGAGGDAGRVADTLYLLQALGDPVSDVHWRSVKPGAGQTGGVPSVAVLAGLERAAAQSRRAETVLYVLHALDGAGEQPHASVVGTAARTLQQIGLEATALAIVREALVAGMR
ncbi:MAG: hypothetical protein CL566_01655 [Alphaproteobacteria bacterium]|nr:hypothetical protein [Alphaproteobacteria bacterium]